PVSVSSGSGGPYPTSCSRGDTVARCPDSASLAAAFQGNDFSPSMALTVTVRDNLAPAATYYDRATLDGACCPAATGTMTPCSWDSNGDGALWVRAQATVGSETRT